MSRNVPAPYFPIPPKTYTPRYFSEIIRAFSVYIEQSKNPGEGRNTFIVLTDVPSGSDVGLEPGTVYEVDGVLKIARLNAADVPGLSASGSVGDVVVVVS